MRIALTIIAIACFALYPLTVFWPSGWAWHAQGQSLYMQMIVGIYATLGVFLLLAARNPLKHVSIIWFAVWSSVVHGAVMMVQSLIYPQHRGHLWGDVPVLFAAAVILAWLAPKSSSPAETSR